VVLRSEQKKISRDVFGEARPGAKKSVNRREVACVPFVFLAKDMSFHTIETATKQIQRTFIFKLAGCCRNAPKNV
jgi:hypothetical protein